MRGLRLRFLVGESLMSEEPSVDGALQLAFCAGGAAAAGLVPAVSVPVFAAFLLLPPPQPASARAAASAATESLRDMRRQGSGRVRESDALRTRRTHERAH